MLSVSLEASSRRTVHSTSTPRSWVWRKRDRDQFGTVRFDPTEVLAAVGGLLPPDLEAIVGAAGTIAGQIDLGAVFSADADELLRPLRDLSSIDAITGGIDLSIPSTGIELDVLGGDIDLALGLVDGPLPARRPARPGSRARPDGCDRRCHRLGGRRDRPRAPPGWPDRRRDHHRQDRAWRCARGRGARRHTRRRRCDPSRADRCRRPAEPDHGGRPRGHVRRRCPPRRVAHLRDPVRAVQESWSTGLGFGEAALVGLEMRLRNADGHREGRARRSLLPAVGSLAGSIRGWLDPVMKRRSQILRERSTTRTPRSSSRRPLGRPSPDSTPHRWRRRSPPVRRALSRRCLR